MSIGIRQRLDTLFAIDAVASVVFGIFSLGAPHGLLLGLFKEYNHSVHETLRLYGCLRLASGWILWHVRKVDDGKFRRHVCEALLACYMFQALAVIRAQLTEEHVLVNWIAILMLLSMSVAYGSFRFGKGGNLIKIYELPSASTWR
jgi:hypothetical protein